jgi:hypothetical protein
MHARLMVVMAVPSLLQQHAVSRVVAATWLETVTTATLCVGIVQRRRCVSQDSSAESLAHVTASQFVYCRHKLNCKICYTTPFGWLELRTNRRAITQATRSYQALMRLDPSSCRQPLDGTDDVCVSHIVPVVRLSCRVPAAVSSAFCAPRCLLRSSCIHCLAQLRLPRSKCPHSDRHRPVSMCVSTLAAFVVKHVHASQSSHCVRHKPHSYHSDRYVVLPRHECPGFSHARWH